MHICVFIFEFILFYFFFFHSTNKYTDSHKNLHATYLISPQMAFLKLESLGFNIYFLIGSYSILLVIHVILFLNRILKGKQFFVSLKIKFEHEKIKFEHEYKSYRRFSMHMSN